MKGTLTGDPTHRGDAIREGQPCRPKTLPWSAVPCSTRRARHTKQAQPNLEGLFPRKKVQVKQTFLSAWASRPTSTPKRPILWAQCPHERPFSPTPPHQTTNIDRHPETNITPVAVSRRVGTSRMRRALWRAVPRTARHAASKSLKPGDTPGDEIAGSEQLR